MPDIPELDELLVGPRFRADPYPTYRRLRDEASVHGSDARGMWLLTRHADVVSTIRDPRRFTKVGHVTQRLDGLPADVLRRVQPLYRNFSVGMATTDPPAHTRIVLIPAGVKHRIDNPNDEVFQIFWLISTNWGDLNSVQEELGQWPVVSTASGWHLE